MESCVWQQPVHCPATEWWSTCTSNTWTWGRKALPRPAVETKQIWWIHFPQKSGQTYKTALSSPEENWTTKRPTTLRLFFHSCCLQAPVLCNTGAQSVSNHHLWTHVALDAIKAGFPCLACSWHSSEDIGSPPLSTAQHAPEAPCGVLGTGWYRKTKGSKRACQASNNLLFKSCWHHCQQQHIASAVWI